MVALAWRMDRVAFLRAALADPAERPAESEGDEGEVWAGRCFFMDAQTARCIYFSPRSPSPANPSKRARIRRAPLQI